jgi:hypothetical protein
MPPRQRAGDAQNRTDVWLDILTGVYEFPGLMEIDVAIRREGAPWFLDEASFTSLPSLQFQEV